MRATCFIFGITSIVFGFSAMAQKPEASSLQRVEKELSALEQKVLKSKDIKAAYEAIYFGKKSLSDLIEGIEYKGSDQEKIEIVRLALYSLPGESVFSKKECPAYKAEMLSTFEPKSKKAKPEDPLVLKVWNILEKLCQ